MTVKRITLAVLTAVALAPALGTSAGAQYYQDDYGYRPRRPPPPDYYDDRPRYGYGRRYRDEHDDGPRRFGRICVTARGNCPARPAPFNTPCGCEIPGFGLKRGAIGG